MTAITDKRWHADVEINPMNASLFRGCDRPTLRLSEAVWVSGELSLRNAGLTLHFISRQDRRLGNQSIMLRVSASGWVQERSMRLFRCEVEIWHRDQRVLVRMSKAQ